MRPDMLTDDLARSLEAAVLARQIRWDRPFSPTEEQAAHMEHFNEGVLSAADAVVTFFHTLRDDE